MGKISEQKDLKEQNLRDLSFEIIITLVESSPKLFTGENKQKLELFIQSLFKYALEMDIDLTEEWTTPQALTFLEEDMVPENQLQLAIGIINRLCDKIESKHLLKILVPIVQDLLAKESEDWRYKYTGFMIITSICEQIDDITEVKNILPLVFDNLKNTSPKIRFACLQVIEISSDLFNPTFQKNYNQEIYPVLLQLMTDSVLRIQLQCSETLISFLEKCPQEIANSNCKNSLDVLFPILMNENTFVSLKESVLNLLFALVKSCPEEFKQYSSKCLEILIKVLSFYLNSGKEKSIYGSLLQVITNIGPNCEEEYKKYIPDIVNAMIQLQNNIPYSTDPLFKYLKSAWEKLIPYTKLYFSDLITPIIQCSIKLVSNTPTMSVSNAPNNEFNLTDLLKDDRQENIISKQKEQIKTSETQEYAESISLLCIIMKNYINEFSPYIETTESLILSMLNFEANEDIRIEAANTTPYLIEIIKKQGNNNNQALCLKAKKYLSCLILVIEKGEDFNGTIICQLDSLKLLIDKAGLFLNQEEIKELFIKLLQIFDKIEKNRIALVKKIEKTRKEFEEDNETTNKINSDDEKDLDDEDNILDHLDEELQEVEDIVNCIADVFGSLFNTHKELMSNEMLNDLLNNVLIKYLYSGNKSSSNYEVKIGLYILDELIEKLGQDMLINLWDQIAKTLFTYVNHKEAFLRQAAVYAIGEFAVNTKKDYSKYSNSINEAIDLSLNYKKDQQQDIVAWTIAKDNAVASLGKVIKYQSQNILEINELIKKWVDFLPIKEDQIEGVKQHQIFVEMLCNNFNILIGSNKESLSKVIRILCKIHDTKFVSDSTNEDILKLLDGIKRNPEFALYIETSIKEANKELKEKIKELFEKI